MNLSELFFYAEAEGQLPTRLGRLNAIINDIKKIPSPTIDSDTLLNICSRNGIELNTLTQKEFNYILNGIK